MHHTPITIENDQYHLNVRTNFACFFWVSGKISISTETTVFSFQLHIQKPRFRHSSQRFFKRFLRRWSKVKCLTDGKTLPVGQQQQNEVLLRRDACLTFPLKLYDTTLVIFHIHLTPHALLTVLEYPVPLVGPRMTHTCTAKQFLQHLKFSVKTLPSLKQNETHTRCSVNVVIPTHRRT
jgi:hypothetical protein